jgi:hypothetical protein
MGRNITPDTYETLRLLTGQNFIINKVDYQIVEELRMSNGLDQEISYLFKRIPDVNGKRWEMTHDRVDELERTNKIKYK